MVKQNNADQIENLNDIEMPTKTHDSLSILYMLEVFKLINGDVFPEISSIVLPFPCHLVAVSSMSF